MDISLLLGVFVGIILGLTGAGGGILAVPALVTGMGLSMQQAAPIALIAIAGSAAIGAIEGIRKKLVRYKAAGLMALSGLPFTTLGLHIARALSQRWLIELFAGVMLIVAQRLIRQSYFPTTMSDHHYKLGHINPISGKFDWSWSTGLLIAGIGALTGFTTGLLGVGGGFIIVPMLRRFTDASMHMIVATSLMVIALVGGSGIINALLSGVTLSLHTTLLFACATATGMLIGRQLIIHLNELHVQRVFALLLAIIAVGFAFKAIL